MNKGIADPYDIVYRDRELKIDSADMGQPWIGAHNADCTSDNTENIGMAKAGIFKGYYKGNEAYPEKWVIIMGREGKGKSNTAGYTQE